MPKNGSQIEIYIQTISKIMKNRDQHWKFYRLAGFFVQIAARSVFLVPFPFYIFSIPILDWYFRKLLGAPPPPLSKVLDPSEIFSSFSWRLRSFIFGNLVSKKGWNLFWKFRKPAFEISLKLAFIAFLATLSIKSQKFSAISEKFLPKKVKHPLASKSVKHN